MKLEYLAIAIVAFATVACALSTRSPPLENRSGKAGNRADRATVFGRADTAAPPARKNIPDPADRWRNLNVPWEGEHIQQQTFTSFEVWKPPVYQLSRPYFIPIYGSNGRIPIYFAPQPYDQGGYDRPPFVGPPYLPPKEEPVPTTQQPPDSTMTIKTRFDFDDDDDRPIWDKGNSNEISEDSDKPPKPPANNIPLSAQEEQNINEIFKMGNTNPTRRPPPRITPRPTQQTTQHMTQRPTQRPRPRTTVTTTTTTERPVEEPPGPSNCVWAVVSCCTSDKNVFHEKCFEQRGCPGPFWGPNPCDTEFAKAAVDSALNYYNP